MKRILIVDDDSDDRELFCEAWLDAHPHDLCYGASDGRKAFVALENHELPFPDLIFLDLNMPVINGYEFLSLIRQTQTYSEIPIIIYSTSSYNDDLRKAFELGALYFFSKPNRFLELKKNLALIGNLLATNKLETLGDHSSPFITTKPKVIL